jgi:RNA polymerase sigma factor (sigma-70 family)
METKNIVNGGNKPANTEEAVLVAEARHDSKAFTALYRHYLTPVYRYLVSRVNNLHEAWLFTIARRRLVDFYRQHPTSQLADPPSQEPSLLSIVENNENIQHLSRLLAQLDEEHRELLRLRFSAGLSFSQISLLDGRSEPAVKMAFYRTISFLQKHWESDNG